MFELVEQVPHGTGDLTVTTKTQFLHFLARPRTIIKAQYAIFQANYNTAEPSILREFHKYFVDLVSIGGVEILEIGARRGLLFEEHSEHLKKHLIAFA